MNQIERALELVTLIQGLGHRTALVGGLAVSLRARERFTRDIDFAVAVATDAIAEQLVMDVQRSGLRLVEIIEQESLGLLATARFADPESAAETPTLDLICASSGIEREAVAEAKSVRVLRQLTLPVAQIPHLIAMKVLAESDSRANDREDLRALLRVAGPRELERAFELVELISRRGFDRGKDLRGELARFADSFRPDHDSRR